MIAYCFKGNPATTVRLICVLHQVHTEQHAVRPDADTEGPVWGCRAAVCPSQGGGGSGSLIISVECTQRKLGQRLQTVTLSDPYWNSQQNNNGTVTNLISSAMTRNIIVSEWWKIKKERVYLSRCRCWKQTQHYSTQRACREKLVERFVLMHSDSNTTLSSNPGGSVTCYLISQVHKKRYYLLIWAAFPVIFHMNLNCALVKH